MQPYLVLYTCTLVFYNFSGLGYLLPIRFCKLTCLWKDFLSITLSEVAHHRAKESIVLSYLKGGIGSSSLGSAGASRNWLRSMVAR